MRWRPQRKVFGGKAGAENTAQDLCVACYHQLQFRTVSLHPDRSLKTGHGWRTNPKGGGSLLGLSDGAKRNHMTPFKGNALSALWWNLNFFFFA